MEYRKSGNTYAVRIDRGEEVIEKLLEFSATENIPAASVSGIGASDKVTVGLYNVENREYKKADIEGEMEITSLLGSLSRENGNPYVHLHINVSGDGMQVYGGHLNYCRISGTCELFVTVFDAAIGRKVDDKTGIKIFEF